MKKVLVIGSSGSIGKRYCAILRWLDVEVIECDPASQTEHLKTMPADGVIIAAPTKRHAELVEIALYHDVPVLCEKPLGTSVNEAHSIIHFKHAQQRLYVVDNWVHMMKGFKKDNNILYKNYFTGNESFSYNLAQPIYLSSFGKFTCDFNFPYFEAKCDGQTFHSSDIDKSYLSMLKRWTSSGLTCFGIMQGIEMQEVIEGYQ